MNLQENIRRILREEEDRYDDKVGKTFWFEYHCYESPESCDAEIWYRSHQKVKVIGVSEWSFDDYEDRMNDGQPRVYLVEWEDGFQYDVFEDELLESPNEFYRPNPPKRKIQESIRRILREELNNYDIVYRGQPEDEYDISPRNSIWVTYDYDFANLYGRVKEYKLPKNLNILDTDYYNEWESLVDEFDEYGDYEEYKYEPTDEFIIFLESKGYDGFINGDNILIFNKNKLFK